MRNVASLDIHADVRDRDVAHANIVRRGRVANRFIRR
jgi:hypothetical protein